MSLEAFRLRELVQVCTELGIELGHIKRKPHIIDLLQAEDVSVEEFTEALGEIRGREREAREREQEVRESKKRAEEEERKRRADEEAHERARKNHEWALECERWELEKREYKREMERLDYEFEQLELARKARELEALCRATTGVEAVTGKACQEKEKVGAGDREMTENQRLSPDTTFAVLGKPDPNSERRDGESDVEGATEVVCQEKRKTEAGDTELLESDAEMPGRAAQQSGQDPDCSDRHPCGFGTKPTAPSQESRRPTGRKVIGISFNEINHSCLVRLRSPDFRTFTESRCKEDASGSESSSRLGDGRSQAGHAGRPATFGGCASKGPTRDTMEPGRVKADPTQVHLRTSSCSRQGGHETKSSDVVTNQRPRKRQRRISVVRSGSDAPCKGRPRKRDERHFKKKQSSWLGGGKLQGPHPNEPWTHSSSAKKEPGEGNNEPRTTQRGSKRRQSSSPLVQPGITSDGETKGDLRDCSFAPARKSKEKNLKSASEAKGVVWTPAWTSVASPAVRPRLSRDQCGLLPLKTHFLAEDKLLRKAPGDDLAPPNRPAQVNARQHRRQVAMVSCARRQSERRIGAANAPCEFCLKRFGGSWVDATGMTSQLDACSHGRLVVSAYSLAKQGCPAHKRRHE
ncbi:hypothetical protein HPB47_012884 [Ixodes persulcatus]|uniref:Uncharacterized protein n=1 Tax=Ixodes persulcatus TaxID=34615 RepID=A0AC60NS78_IXOPE|nr:hypothetical protein HPB47_012884 [Ixodes persulcatus]